MHYIIVEKEKLNGAFEGLKETKDGRVIMSTNLLNKIRFSLEDVDILTDKDAIELI